MPAVGLTGGYGTGKSTAAKMFLKLGARVLNADHIAHGTLSLSKPSGRRIVKLFGRGIVQDKRISRDRLGKIVFSDPKKRKALERVVHPLVGYEIRSQLRRASKRRIVIVEVPLLIEAGMHRSMDYTIVVATDRKTQLKRLKARGVARQDAIRRIKSQMPLAKKKNQADFIINNSGSRRETRQQVARIWKKLTS